MAPFRNWERRTFIRYKRQFASINWRKFDKVLFQKCLESCFSLFFQMWDAPDPNQFDLGKEKAKPHKQEDVEWGTK
jgi:hypothetical protein